MSANGNEKEIAVVEGKFELVPRNLDEAMKFADLIAKSTIIPTNFHGKPGDVLVAMQMGMEVGLKPLQALQNIAVINGKPCIWGDAALAVVQASKLMEDFEETFDEATQTATCRAKRKGQASEIRGKFSIEDAKKAGLAGKQGPWTNYTKRMLKLRARGFTLRDGFADVLKGLAIREEVEDYEQAPAATPAGETLPALPRRASQQVVDTTTVAPPAAPAPEAPAAEAPPKAEPKISVADRKSLVALASSHNVEATAIKAYLANNFNVSDSAELTVPQFVQVKAWIENPERF